MTTSANAVRPSPLSSSSLVQQQQQQEEDDLLAYAHVQSLLQIKQEIHALRSAIPALLAPLLHAPVSSAAPSAAEAVPATAMTPPGSTTTTTRSPSSATAAAAATTTTQTAVPPRQKSVSFEPQVEFRQQAQKAHRDVKQLVANLERVCDTLEATERVRRVQEEQEAGGAKDGQAMPLLRSHVVKDATASPPAIQQQHAPRQKNDGGLATTRDEADEAATHAPLVNAEYLFSPAADNMTSATIQGAQGDAEMDAYWGTMYNDYGLDAYTNDWADIDGQP